MMTTPGFRLAPRPLRLSPLRPSYGGVGFRLRPLGFLRLWPSWSLAPACRDLSCCDPPVVSLIALPVLRRLFVSRATNRARY
jgi:hypothetical protein